MPRMHINFSGPENGWLGIHMQANGEQIIVNASYTPHDTLTEFAEALVQIIESGSCMPIRVNEEPQASIVQFSRHKDHLVITHAYSGVVSDKPPKVLKAPFRSATREIARKLMFLYKEVGYNQFVSHWRHRPPKEQIARAWKHFEQ